MHWRWKCWCLPAVQMRGALMCSNQVTNLQRQAQPHDINRLWGRQKNFDASRCSLNSLLFFLELLQSSSCNFFRKCLVLLYIIKKLDCPTWYDIFFCSLYKHFWMCEPHFYCYHTWEYRFMSSYSKLEGKCERVIFHISADWISHQNRKRLLLLYWHLKSFIPNWIRAKSGFRTGGLFVVPRTIGVSRNGLNSKNSVWATKLTPTSE